GVPGLGGGARDEAHAADEALTLGDADGAAGVEDVEEVAALHDAVVGREHQPLERRLVEDERSALPPLLAQAEQVSDLPLELVEERLMEIDVGSLEVVRGPLPLGALEDLAVADAGRPLEVVDVVHVLQVHRDALEPVGQLAADGLAVDPAALLEIRELADLEPVEPDLPAEPPRPERGRLPVVLDEADVVLARIGADGAQGLEVELLDVARRGLEDDLVLVELLEAVRVVPVATVGRATRRL